MVQKNSCGPAEQWLVMNKYKTMFFQHAFPIFSYLNYTSTYVGVVSLFEY